MSTEQDESRGSGWFGAPLNFIGSVREKLMDIETEMDKSVGAVQPTQVPQTPVNDVSTLSSIPPATDGKEPVVWEGLGDAWSAMSKREEKDEEEPKCDQDDVPASPLVVSDEKEPDDDEMSRLKAVLDEREKQLERQQAEASKLMDMHTAVTAQLNAALAEKGSTSEQLNQIKDEFSVRLAQVETNLLSVTRERDEMKQKIEKEAQNKESDGKQEEARENELTALRDEGEALAMKQMTLESIIKKLRAELQEKDTKTTSLEARVVSLESSAAEEKRLRKNAEEAAKANESTVDQVKSVAQFSSRQLAQLRSQLDTAEKRVRELESELKHSHETSESDKANALAAARKALETASATSGEREATLGRELVQLRAQLTRVSDKAARTEESSRQEIHDLRDQLSDAIERNDELAAAVPDATGPLLRQIKALQDSIDSRRAVWEETEANLTARVNSAEALASTAGSRVKAAEASSVSRAARIAALERDLTDARQDNDRVVAECAALMDRAMIAENAIRDHQAEAESSRAAYNRCDAERQDASTRVSVVEGEVERCRDAMKRLEQQLSDATSRAERAEARVRAETIIASLPTPTPTPVYQPDTVVGMESLRSQLRLREGEIDTLRETLEKAENDSKALVSESVILNGRLGSLEETEKECLEYRQRYEQVLELAGEKSERVDELQQDLDDIKVIYREQLLTLMEQLGK